MNTVTIIAIMVIAVILYFAIRYIYKEKKEYEGFVLRTKDIIM